MQRPPKWVLSNRIGLARAPLIIPDFFPRYYRGMKHFRWLSARYYAYVTR